jgi:hypothetical protein
MHGPDEIPVGTLVRYTASVSQNAPKGTVAKWSLDEPGRKTRDLGKSLAITYVAPRRLLGKTITVRSLLTEAGAKPIEIKVKVVAHEAATLPTRPVTAELAPGWTKDGGHHGASIDGASEFLVGRPATWRKNKKVISRGLALAAGDAQFFYSPGDHANLGHWANVIACSTDVEGGGAFEALNTYDRATFTFGLIQFGAHTYNDNFHVFLRSALKRFPQEGGYYFPELRLHKNKVDLELQTDADADAWQPLTQKDVPDNGALRRFIKPLALEVSSSEVLFAARMVHWTRAQPGLRKIMVEMAVDRARANFKGVADALDGKGIAVCAAVFDIRLQGRAKSKKQIEKALGSSNPLDSLLAIKAGTPGEDVRLAHLKTAIEKRFKDSKVKYDAKTGELK